MITTHLNRGSNAQVVVEVDGPSHFAANTRRPLGHTALRNGLLATLPPAGVAVALVPH